MIKSIEAFADALGREYAYYQAMTELSEKKRMAISANDLKAIVDITAEENDLLAKIAVVAGERLEKSLELAKHYELSTDDMTLRVLIARMPPDIAGPLEELRERFLRLLNQLSRNTEVMAEVLSERMRSTRAAINTLSQAEPLGTNYTRYGQTTSGAQNRLHMLDTDI